MALIGARRFAALSSSVLWDALRTRSSPAQSSVSLQDCHATQSLLSPPWRSVQPFSSSSDADVQRSADKLLELLASSPSMQQVMLASLPASVRNQPDVIKSMLSHPGVKQKLAEMISKQGVKLPTAMLDRMSPAHMEQMMSWMQRLGINPADIPGKLMHHPEIFKQLQEPHIMQAFLETMERPEAASKYSAQVMEVVRQAHAVLNLQPGRTPAAKPAKDAAVHEPSAGAPAAAIPAASSSAAISLGAGQGTDTPPSPAPTPTAASAVGAPPPGSPASQAASSTPPSSSSSSSGPTVASSEASQVPFLQLLSQDPSLAPKLANPRVLQALQEISKSPWKTIKYIFDKDVMEVFTALNKMLGKATAKPPNSKA